MLGYCLALGDEHSAWLFSAWLSMRLSREELIWLAFATLTALDEDDSRLIRELAP